jgi:ferredoxin
MTLPTTAYLIDRSGLTSLFEALHARGYRTIGPIRRDQAIVYDEIAGPDELPAGWTERQTNARYELVRREDDRLFGFTVGPESWKRFLFPPRVCLVHITRAGHGFSAEPPASLAERQAFIGVRACDLAAIARQDRILTQGPVVDRDYALRRRNTFLVGVQCTEAGGNCFCASMGTGPRAEAGFDLALTEDVVGGGHRFLVEVGSPAGADLVADLAFAPASAADLAAARAASARAAGKMGRRLPAGEVKPLLEQNLDSRHWAEVGQRCLACANCTMVCPTCFCTSVREASDLTAATASRWRVWDSCFSAEYSYIHGGSTRPQIGSRYRQWITHKLAWWQDQFGESGCVGCGRCITWCPVGIDITEEVAALARQTPRATGEGT